jgi:hypothetical protein
MSEPQSQKELELFQRIAAGLSEFDRDTQARILQTVMTFFNLGEIGARVGTQASNRQTTDSMPAPVHSFTNLSTVSPKDFLAEKAPHSDIERVACLAYYLTHYRDTPHFATLDISKLNTEAAQPKFTNAAQAMKNSTYRGLIVASSSGRKQLSSMGEQYVQALPDRDAAKHVLERIRPRKLKKPKARSKTKQPSKDNHSE